MRIIHVVPYIGEEASGPAYTTTALNRAMNDLGASSRLVVGVDGGIGPESANGTLVAFRRRRFPRRLGRSPEMYCWLQEQVASGAVDIVHNNSIWMMPNIYPGWATRGTDVALVVSPRGTFSKWALSRSRAVKFLFWHGLQKRAIEVAALFHATAESEYEDIRRLGFRQPVAVIPNGVDVPVISGEASRGDGERTLLFVSRIHPTKGLENLLQAWVALQDAHPLWRLRIVGPGDPAYVGRLRKLAGTLGARRVEFAGPLYGHDKQLAYQTADLFVLPTHSENFGMVVAEALAAGCPVVTTRGAPWSGLVEHRAGWWIDIGVEPLRLALDEAMAKHPRELAEMGARGRAWMEREFSWKELAARMIDTYRWIREGGVRPKWVHND